MANINIRETNINGLLIIEPMVFKDNRGSFQEIYNYCDYSNTGINTIFVQDNISISNKGVLRGLHFQLNCQQEKLIFVAKGRIFDVAVDIRKGSETYGEWFGIELSEENNKQLYIPKGFAHGFLALEDKTILIYKCSDYYHPNDEGGIIWNDPEIGIKWPIEEVDNIILSEKDKRLNTLDGECYLL